MSWLPWKESKPQVFVCHVMGSGESREKWLGLSLEAWSKFDVPVKLLMPDGRINSIEFQRQRRIEAERQSREDFYILADDDCLPIGQSDYLLKGIEILKRHPEFAILSPLPSNESIVEWTPAQEDNYTAFKDGEVFEHVSVGGIRFCRKGAMADWPPMGEGKKDYDRTQGDFLRLQGKRVGYMRYLKFEHLGKGVSTVWELV